MTEVATPVPFVLNVTDPHESKSPSIQVHTQYFVINVLIGLLD